MVNKNQLMSYICHGFARNKNMDGFTTSSRSLSDCKHSDIRAVSGPKIIRFCLRHNKHKVFRFCIRTQISSDFTFNAGPNKFHCTVFERSTVSGPSQLTQLNIRRIVKTNQTFDFCIITIMFSKVLQVSPFECIFTRPSLHSHSCSANKQQCDIRF